MIDFVNKYARNIHSQNGEDGITIEILSRLRLSSGKCVEVGANDGLWCSNTAFLLESAWGWFDGVSWTGKMIESDLNLLEKCRENWRGKPHVQVIRCHVDASLINVLVGPDCDLLSLDTDGADYEIFKGLTFKPKIVIVEIDSSIPPDQYAFNADGGAGYKPMVEMGIAKGYFLLAHTGNLVLVSNDYRDLFPEIVGDPLIDSENYFNRSWLKEVKGYCTMLSIGNYGRFCNGAYQVAGVLGVARRNGLEPVFPLWQNKDHRDRFGSTEDIDVYKHFVNPLPPVPEGIQWNPERPVEWGYHDIDLPAGNWNISGHFQSTRYFQHCLEEVRWYMRMKDEPIQNDYVAIHLRCADYSSGEGYHPRLGMEYYGPAMARFLGEKFLVFSDDLTEAKRIFGATVEYSQGNYIEDFKLMKTCRHFIIGNSSYSAFAAVLGEAKDKRVVAPRPWFGPKYTSITGEDIYNPNWEVIDYKIAEAA